MDYFAILAAGIGGAIGGLIGGLISQRLTNKTAKSVAYILPVVLMMQLAPELAKNQALRDRLSPPSPFELLIRKSTAEFNGDPIITKALAGKNGAEAHAFMQQQTKLGLKRLPLADLQTWNDLRFKMAKVNPVVCAGFWTGNGITGDVLQKALMQLEERDAETWVKTSMLAAKREIEQTPFEPPPQSAIQNGIQKIQSALSKEDRDRFGAVLISGLKAEDQDACWAMTLLFKGAEGMEGKEREEFLRGMASL